MSVERLEPVEGGDDKVNQLAARWLADLRATGSLSSEDENFLRRLEQMEAGPLVLAAQQRRREAYEGNFGNDIIEDQLRVIKDVFGRTRQPEY